MNAWFRWMFFIPALLLGDLHFGFSARAADGDAPVLDLRAPTLPALDAQGRTEMRAADGAQDSAALRNLRAVTMRRPYGTGYEARRSALEQEIDPPGTSGRFSFNASNPAPGGTATSGAARGGAAKSSGAASGAASGAGQGGRGRR